MYTNILDYFSDTVEEKTGKIAVIHNSDSITFGELDRRSRHLAKKLLQIQGNEEIVPVAVFLSKSINVVVADIAVTYSGNFFSNLDVKTPISRLRNILDVMKPGVIITDEKFGRVLTALDNLSIPLVYIDKIEWPDGEETIADKTLDQRLRERIDTDPFCIINTSGSTGTPKGVILNHRSFFDFMTWSIEEFGFDGSEIIGSLSPTIFDIYVFELCLAMVKGSTIVLLDEGLAVFPVRLLQEVQRQKVNFIFWVPTIMVNIANMGLLEKIPLPDLNLIWFAGEVFPTKQFNMWRRMLPHSKFVNLYGPIEITLDCIVYVAENELPENQPLPIGRPCKNTDVLLLNENDEKCRQEEVGEICVRGTSLAMGYYNNPEKTAAAFVQNPLNKSYPELIYRTGDLAYVDENGLFMFKGRKDSLIKHMGYRIELGEIEHVIINKLKLVKNCCAVYDFNKKEIALIYEVVDGLREADFRKAIATEFPRYMVPKRYIPMDELPRNTNGKIDRNLLKQQVNN